MIKNSPYNLILFGIREAIIVKIFTEFISMFAAYAHSMYAHISYPTASIEFVLGCQKHYKL